MFRALRRILSHNMAFFYQIQHFLQFVKNVYKELPNHLNKIFEPRATIKVKDLSEITTEALLAETFTTTTIQTEKKSQDGTSISVGGYEKYMQFRIVNNSSNFDF